MSQHKASFSLSLCAVSYTVNLIILFHTGFQNLWHQLTLCGGVWDESTTVVGSLAYLDVAGSTHRYGA